MTLSAYLHSLIYSDTHESLCSRAWRLRDHPFWAAWVFVFGKKHCKKSYDRYWE